MISKTIEEIHQMIGGKLYLNKQKKDTCIDGVSIDSRSTKKNNIYVAISGERVDGHDFTSNAEQAGASLIIASNKDCVVSKAAIILVDDSIKAIQDLAHNYRKQLKTKIIGITGSNGKTSCKDILAAMLSSKYKVHKTEGNMNNELGVPLTLLAMDEDCDYGVLEMGMENLEDIHFLNKITLPNMGIVMNVGIAHLENLGSLDNIGRAKLELIDGLSDNSLFVYYGDDPILKKIIKEKDISTLNVKTFGDNKSDSIYLTSFKQQDNTIYFKSNLSDYEFKLETLGKHQAFNALAAILCAYNIGLSDLEVAEGLLRYKSTGMRNELLKINECTILNDAYKSNPQSAHAALETFQGINNSYKIIVLADMLDLGEQQHQFHYDLGKSLVEFDYDELLCYGPLSIDILEGAQTQKPLLKYLHFENQDELFNYLKPYMNKDCAILFKGSRGLKLDKIIERLEGEVYEKN